MLDEFVNISITDNKELEDKNKELEIKNKELEIKNKELEINIKKVELEYAKYEEEKKNKELQELKNKNIYDDIIKNKKILNLLYVNLSIEYNKKIKKNVIYFPASLNIYAKVHDLEKEKYMNNKRIKLIGYKIITKQYIHIYNNKKFLIHDENLKIEN